VGVAFAGDAEQVELSEFVRIEFLVEVVGVWFDVVGGVGAGDGRLDSYC